TLGGDEGAPEPATLLPSNRDVVEVGLLRAEAPGARDRLVERGVDAVVVGDIREQALAVRRTELLELAVAQQLLDDGVLATQLLQGGGVGGEARLRALLGLEAELVEQDAPELLRRV